MFQKKHIYTTCICTCMYSCSQSHKATNYACTCSAVYRFSKPLWLLKVHCGYFLSHCYMLYIYIYIYIYIFIYNYNDSVWGSNNLSL